VAESRGRCYDPIPEISTVVWRCSPLLLSVVLLALACARPAAAAQQPASTPAEAVESLESQPSLGPGAVFPDPRLMKQAKVYRGVGVTLSVVGAVAFVASFNISLAVMRSGDEQLMQMMPAWTVPSMILMGIGLEVGGPLWSVGSEMVRQLTRDTRGDEKLRRSVANDPRYWQGRLMNAFGTAMALSGGIQLTIGTLMLVGTIWVIQRADMIEEESGRSVSPAIIALPISLIAGGTGLMIGGLLLRRDGLDRAKTVREAHQLTHLMVVPYADPYARAGGFVLSARF